MVFLIVKGTKWRDEFLYECSLDRLCGALASTLVKILNFRYMVQLQLFSVDGLMDAAAKSDLDLGKKYKERHTELYTVLKDPKAVITDDSQWEKTWFELRDLTTALFPKECLHKEGYDAAVGELWKKHEDPEIDEEYRLHVYHCRAVLDPDNRFNERMEEEGAALFFCAKELEKDQPLSKYVGNNEKSKVVVKLGKSGGAPPSKEPTIAYDQQRQLRAEFDKRRAEFATLEEPELRDRVMAMRREEAMEKVRADIPKRGGGAPGQALVPDPKAFRPIRANAEETVIEGA